jgi:hypothetical protein
VIHLHRPEPAKRARAKTATACDSLFLRLLLYNVVEMSLKLYLVAADLLHPGDCASFREHLLTLGARQVLTEVGAEWASRRALANLGEL